MTEYEKRVQCSTEYIAKTTGSKCVAKATRTVIIKKKATTASKPTSDAANQDKRESSASDAFEGEPGTQGSGDADGRTNGEQGSEDVGVVLKAHNSH